MPPRKFGNRYKLLVYHDFWNRLWKPTLFLGALLAVIWWQAGTQNSPLIQTANSPWVLLGAIVSLLMGVLAFLLRNMSYVQPTDSYFRLVTPFLRLKISYRRVRTIHPIDLVQAFPPREQSWSQRRFLRTFYGETAVAVELHGYPLSRMLLRLFLSPLIYLPQSTGFVFVVDDWMKLSTELDARIASWQDRKKPRQRLPGV